MYHQNIQNAWFEPFIYNFYLVLWSYVDTWFWMSICCFKQFHQIYLYNFNYFCFLEIQYWKHITMASNNSCSPASIVSHHQQLILSVICAIRSRILFPNSFPLLIIAHPPTPLLTSPTVLLITYCFHNHHDADRLARGSSSTSKHIIS